MQRFLNGIEFIETHLMEPIELSDVAKAAALSPYHFARSFRALTGETVMGYVRRRRLTQAAERLSQDDVRVLELALDVGFESQEAFTRAFKRQFHVTPGQWVREGHTLTGEARLKLDLSYLKHRKEHVTMEPTFKETEEIKVIGMMSIFSDETKKGIPDLWDAFAPRMGEIIQRIDGVTYGVCFPAETQEGEFEYMAAIAVENFDEIPEGMVGRTVPAHKYAVFTHKTGDDTLHNDLQKSVQYIWGVWLPKSGFEHAKVPDFEYYDHRMDPFTGKGEFDLYLPIK